MRVVFITNTPWPAQQDVVDAAEAVGAKEILHSIPVSLSTLIPYGTLGLYEVPDPPAIEEPSNPLVALLDALAVATDMTEVNQAAAEARESL